MSVLDPSRSQGAVLACGGTRQSSAGCMEGEGEFVEGS